MNLRRTIAEAGLDYSALESAYKDGSIRKQLEPTKAPTDDIDEIVKLIEEHFSVSDGKTNEVKIKGIYLVLFCSNFVMCMLCRILDNLL